MRARCGAPDPANPSGSPPRRSPGTRRTRARWRSGRAAPLGRPLDLVGAGSGAATPRPASRPRRRGRRAPSPCPAATAGVGWSPRRGRTRHVAVPGVPVGEPVAGQWLHVDVDREEVVARLDPVLCDVVDEEVGGDPLADRTPLHVGERDHHRVDGAVGDLGAQRLEARHQSAPGERSAPAVRRSESPVRQVTQHYCASGRSRPQTSATPDRSASARGMAARRPAKRLASRQSTAVAGDT